MNHIVRQILNSWPGAAGKPFRAIKRTVVGEACTHAAHRMVLENAICVRWLAEDGLEPNSPENLEKRNWLSGLLNSWFRRQLFRRHFQQNNPPKTKAKQYGCVNCGAACLQCGPSARVVLVSKTWLMAYRKKTKRYPTSRILRLSRSW